MAVPILVGREREQQFLRNELDSAIGGRGRLVLIGGEAGIGKTSLARDLIDRAAELGVRTLGATCHDLMHTPPYGPWLDVFGICEADPNLPSPPEAFVGGRVQPVTDQAELYASVRRFLAGLASERPVVLLIDDLHWADHASLALLRQVAPHLDRWPILMIGAHRMRGVTRDHPFYHQFPILIREANGLRIDLRRLDAVELHALVESRCPSLDPGDRTRLVDYLLRHTEGNPFFTTEIIRTLEDERLLNLTDGKWVLAGLDRVVVPSLVRQLIDSRAARLGDEARRALAIAAVIGNETTVELWSILAGISREALLDIVERAVDAHLLEATPDGTRARFVHPLTRAALYACVIPPRRRDWHRQAAETLMADAEADPDSVAYHLQQAGDPRAWQWLEWAGDRAQLAYAWLTASDRLRAAAGLLERVAGQERKCCELLLRVAYLLRFADTDASFAALDEASALARRIGEWVLAAEIRLVRGTGLCYTERFRMGLAELDGGLVELETLPLDMSRRSAVINLWFPESMPTTTDAGTADDANLFRRLGEAGIDFRRCISWWTRAAIMPSAAAAEGCARFVSIVAETPGSGGGIRRANGFAYHGLGIAAASLGQPDRARQSWEASRQLFSEVDHFALIALSMIAELRDVALTYGASDPGARRRLAGEAAVALGKASSALRPGVSPDLTRLGCLVIDGCWHEADRILSTMVSPGNAFLRREVTAAETVLARHRGEPEIAWSQIRSLLPAGPGSEPGNNILQEGLFLQRLAAELCLDAGDTATAHAWLSAHDRWLAWGGCVLGQAEGELVWTRYHHDMGNTDQARSRLARTIALSNRPEQPLVLLAAYRVLGEIEATAGFFDEADLHFTTALALAERCEAPFERALTLVTIAEARRAAGCEVEARELALETRELLAPLGAAPALDRLDALAGLRMPPPRPSIRQDRLTVRELDVLRLLALGRSNQTIADDLFISRETVRTHVSSIFRKLDVHTRAEAVDFAHRQGLL